MSEYAPPFEITNKIISLLSEIAESLGKISTARELEAHPHLRRNNRIRSIHSSLAIEANSLSVDEVRGVIDGRTVLGSQTEIQEVKNAYRAYDEIGSFDPFSLSELKRLHGIMTYLTVNEAGKFRSGEEGVFDGDRCIFMAPPAHLVPQLTEDLFLWMNKEKNALHPLILSSVFHYEFVFIHPFCDGNGRIARLWHTTPLSKWKPIFEYIPLESQIDKILDDISKQVNEDIEQIDPNIKKLLDVMEDDVSYSSNELMQKLNLKAKEGFRRNYLRPAIDQNLIYMTIPDKPKSKNQRYIKV